MIGRNTPGYLTVHFFGPRTVYIMCTQSGFNMPYGDLLVKSRQCSGCRGCSISMNQYYIRMNFFQDITHTQQYSGSNVVQILSLLHDIQVIIRLDIENMENLVKHFTVLSGYANQCFKLMRSFLELFHQRGHFYSFWTCSKNQKNSFHISIIY